jgi:integrase
MTRRRNYGSGTIVEKSENKWLLRIDYGRNPLTGRRDRRSSQITGSRTDAQRKLTELLSKRDTGLAIACDKTRVDDWLEGWLARHLGEGHITARVAKRYEGIIRNHVNPHIGRMKVQDLRSHHVSDLKVLWLRTLQPATVNKQLVVIHQAFDEAVGTNLIPRNPVDAVQKPSTKRRVEQRALSEQEIGLLLGAARGTRYEVPIKFTLATGLRQGELLSLRWADINLTGEAVNLRGTKTANSRRTIELSASAVQMLRVHRQTQREHRLKLGAAWGENNYAFPSSVGTRWLARAFYRDYRRIVDRSDIDEPDEVKWHTLRHTAASQWILRGADIFTVSRRLGHASSSFTMDTYAHLLKGQQKIAAEALDHLLA